MGKNNVTISLSDRAAEVAKTLQRNGWNMSKFVVEQILKTYDTEEYYLKKKNELNQIKELLEQDTVDSIAPTPNELKSLREAHYILLKSKYRLPKLREVHNRNFHRNLTNEEFQKLIEKWCLTNETENNNL